MRVNWPLMFVGLLTMVAFIGTQQIIAGVFGNSFRAGFLAFFGIG